MVSVAAASSPCAACKFLRRKCQPDCVFAPYFPPDQPQKFVHVHRVFGASNVTKMLNEVHPCHREDAVNSLAYEADMRLRDPVYGCVGVISLLQHQLRQLRLDLALARGELARLQQQSAAAAAAAGNGLLVDVNLPAVGFGLGHFDLFPAPPSLMPPVLRDDVGRNVYDEAVPKNHMAGTDGSCDDAAGGPAAMGAAVMVMGEEFLKPRMEGGSGEERPAAAIAPMLWFGEGSSSTAEDDEI